MFATKLFKLNAKLFLKYYEGGGNIFDVFLKAIYVGHVSVVCCLSITYAIIKKSIYTKWDSLFCFYVLMLYLLYVYSELVYQVFA